MARSFSKYIHTSFGNVQFYLFQLPQHLILVDLPWFWCSARGKRTLLYSLYLPPANLNRMLLQVHFSRLKNTVTFLIRKVPCPVFVLVTFFYPFSSSTFLRCGDYNCTQYSTCAHKTPDVALLYISTIDTVH